MSHRTQITLTDEQYERLQRESERTGLSLAALLRSAVDRCYGSATSKDASLALGASFGAWTERDFDGERYGRLSAGRPIRISSF